MSDIRNWIRNIEQHASDNVNKILVGNKADMDESKRVCPTYSHLFFVFWLCLDLCLLWLLRTIWCGTMLSLGCSNFKGPSSCRWIWHQVFWDGKWYYGTCCSCWTCQNCWYVFNTEIMVMQSAKTNMNVDEVFFSIARDIKQRLADNDSKTEVFVLNFLPSDDECVYLVTVHIA